MDPIDESSRGYYERPEPELAIQQRSISTQNGRPINQYWLRKPAVRIDHERAAAATTERSREDQSVNPSKPTRRTFTRKPTVATTTPANRRTTKRYHNKKNNSLKVETSTINSPAIPRYSTTTPSTADAGGVRAKPFRVATRHQGQLKAKGQKNFKKFDDEVEEDNYPEHFKLLLKNKPQQAQPERIKVSSASPTKAYRVENVKATVVDQAEPEKRIHSALRKPNKLRTRPLLNQRVPSTTTTEAYQPVIEDLVTEIPSVDEESDRRGENLIEDEIEKIIQPRFQYSEEFDHPIPTEDPLLRNEQPKGRGFVQFKDAAAPSAIQPVGSPKRSSCIQRG